jgi:hypothetical protein
MWRDDVMGLPLFLHFHVGLRTRPSPVLCATLLGCTLQRACKGYFRLARTASLTASASAASISGARDANA